jgi:hypothetical protein
MNSPEIAPVTFSQETWNSMQEFKQLLSNQQFFKDKEEDQRRYIFSLEEGIRDALEAGNYTVAEELKVTLTEAQRTLRRQDRFSKRVNTIGLNVVMGVGMDSQFPTEQIIHQDPHLESIFTQGK